MTNETEKEPEQEREEDEEKTFSVIEETKKATADLRAATKERLALVKREERLHVEKSLGGHANVTPQKLEETPKEYADRVMRGDVDGS